MINDLQDLSKGSRSQNFNNLKTVCNMIADNGFVVIFLISEVILFFVFSQVGFVTNVIQIFVVFDFLFFKFGEVHRIEMVSYDWLVVELLDTERRKLFFDEFIQVTVNDLRVGIGMGPELFTGGSFEIWIDGIFLFLGQ